MSFFSNDFERKFFRGATAAFMCFFRVSPASNGCSFQFWSSTLQNPQIETLAFRLLTQQTSTSRGFLPLPLTLQNLFYGESVFGQRRRKIPYMVVIALFGHLVQKDFFFAFLSVSSGKRFQKANSCFAVMSCCHLLGKPSKDSVYISKKLCRNLS